MKIRVLQENEMAPQYLLRNGCVWVDDGGTGEVLSPDKVVALSDGSLFLKSMWDSGKAVITSADRVAVWITDEPESKCEWTGKVKVLVKYGKDLRQDWLYLFNLTLVQPVGETQTLEPFVA